MAALRKWHTGIHMNFPGFMAGFLMLRVFAKEYFGDRANFASESIVATSDMIKRS